MSLLATAVNQLVSPYDGGLDKQVARSQMKGASTVALQDTTLTLSSREIQYLTATFNTDTFMSVLNDKPDGSLLIGAQTCSVTEAENTSALVQVNRIPVGFNLTMNPAQYGVGAYPDVTSENYIAYEQDFQRKLFTRVESLGRFVEEQVVNAIDAAKNTLWDAETLSILAQVNDALDIPAADLGRFYNFVLSAMGNMYLGLDSMQYNVIHNPNHSRTVSFYSNQGLSNGVNTAYQYVGGNQTPTMPIGNYNFAVSNEVANDIGRTGTSYVIPRGSLALLNVNDNDARRRSRATDGTEWGEEYFPQLDMTLGYRYSSGCGNASVTPYGGNVANNTASLVERWQIFTQIIIITPYNPDPLTNHSPIVKFAELS